MTDATETRLRKTWDSVESLVDHAIDGIKPIHATMHLAGKMRPSMDEREVEMARGGLIRLAQESRSCEAKRIAALYLERRIAQKAKVVKSRPSDRYFWRFLEEGWKSEWFDNSLEAQSNVARIRKEAEESKSKNCDRALWRAIGKMKYHRISPLWCIDAMAGTETWKGREDMLADTVFRLYAKSFRSQVA